jgi:hypothetical protein
VPRVLLIGFDPAALPQVDAADVAPAFEHARSHADAAGLDLVECLIAPDETADALVRAALRDGVWECVVIGGGIRKPEAVLELFEYVVNLVHRLAPGAALAFDTSPADTVEAALRALAAAI